MLPLLAAGEAELVLMHMRGTPRDMQRAPWYEDPVAEVAEYLRGRAAAALDAGVARERLLLDPGIGFGKRVADNVELLRRLPELRSLGLPLYVGVSRKSFLDRLAGESGGAADPALRLARTAAAVAACVLGGAEYLRVHDVAAMRGAAAVARALRDGASAGGAP
jgi:dihydropteroate synthase